MNKTKIFILTTTISVLVVIAIVGASYAQTLNQPNYTPNIGNGQVSQVQTLPSSTGAYGGGNYMFPGMGGAYNYGTPQNGYSYGMGMRGGMMGGYNR